MIGERSPSTILMAISKDVIAPSLCCNIWCTCSRVMIIDPFINKLLSNRNAFQPFSADLLWSLTGNFKVTFSSGWVQDSPWHSIIFQPNPPSGKLNLDPKPHGKKKRKNQPQIQVTTSKRSTYTRPQIMIRGCKTRCCVAPAKSQPPVSPRQHKGQRHRMKVEDALGAVAGQYDDMWTAVGSSVARHHSHSSSKSRRRATLWWRPQRSPDTQGWLPNGISATTAL